MRFVFLLSALLFSLLSQSGFSQSWLWGKHIGSSHSMQNQAAEAPEDMIADNNGNIYIISHVYPLSSLSVDGNSMGSVVNSNSLNTFMNSFTCDGTHRWSKIIGTTYGNFTKSIQVDTMGGIYLLTKSNIDQWRTLHIHNDTAFSGIDKQVAIMKFDTSGVFQWLKTPLSDTITYQYALSENYGIDMHVSPNGDISALVELQKGKHNPVSLILSETDTYLLRYDKDGEFQSSTRIPFKVRGTRASYRFSTNMTVAPNGNISLSGHIWVLGNDTLYVNDNVVACGAFLVTFSPAGQMLWGHYTQNSPTSSRVLRRAAVDEQSNVFISGKGLIGEENGFAGYSFPVTMPHNMPFVAKFNPAGDLLWVRYAITNASTIAHGIAYSNQRIGIVGSYPGTVSWPGFEQELQNVLNQGYDPFIAIMNSTDGALVALDTLAGLFGFNDFGRTIAADQNGNFFIAGQFNPNISIAGNMLQAIGTTDIFLGKFGNPNCDFDVITSENKLNQTENRFTVFPNPSNGKFTYSISTSEKNHTIRIFDLQGRDVYLLRNQMNNESEIYLTHLKRGIYILQVETSESMNQARIVIQ